MMKTTLFSFLTLCLGLSLFAQDPVRYVDPMFDVMAPTTGVYAQNKTVITGTPVDTNLIFQVYMPANDTETNRAVAVVQPSGTYLPFILNNAYTGSIVDSVVVATATRLASMGYVTIIQAYREGWNPASTNEEVRTGTLINAAYRGGIDTRTMMRYLRKTVAEDSNPLGIDTTKIMLFGYGTGAYNVYTSNFLDRYEEVVLGKFLDSTNTPYVITPRDGNPFGTEAAPLNTPNWVGYDSDYAFGVAVGGAMGDGSWADGTNESPIVALHGPLNTSAPFADGSVNVFTGFVVDVSGPRTVIEAANANGSNDKLNDINALLAAENDFITLRVNDLKSASITTPDGVTTSPSVDNLYPFIGPDLGNGFYAPYNWIDSAAFTQVVAFYNTQVPAGLQRDGVAIVNNDKLNNPNTTDAAGAKRYIDTIMNFVIPRAYAAMDLGDINVFSKVVDLNPQEVGFTLFPNPVREVATITVNDDVQLQVAALYDMKGSRVFATTTLGGNQTQISRNGLPSGQYTLLLRTDKGTISSQVFFQ